MKTNKKNGLKPVCCHFQHMKSYQLIRNPICRDDCGCCKADVDAVQCGFPVHNYCYKPSKGVSTPLFGLYPWSNGDREQGRPFLLISTLVRTIKTVSRI